MHAAFLCLCSGKNYLEKEGKEAGRTGRKLIKGRGKLKKVPTEKHPIRISHRVWSPLDDNSPQP